MIDKQTIFEIHRLHNNLGFSINKVATKLVLDWKTVAKYLENPTPDKPQIKRSSKLDPFKDEIAKLLEIDPTVSAVVIKQRIDEHGYDGGISILKDYLAKVRPKKEPEAFTPNNNSKPGQQIQIDWGHFNTLEYGNHKRKLYCLAVVESYSGFLYVEFTHSQNQQTLHNALYNSFLFFGGTPEEAVVDGMITAVRERKGSVIRFNDAFLDFLIPFHITPHACNPRAPWEKGGVEGAIKLIRYNFWPLREFTDIGDVNLQCRQWLAKVANVRINRATRERLIDRFTQCKMRPLPEYPNDFRETLSIKVYKDFAVRFDSNTYTTPPWLIGKYVTLKADQALVTLYYKDKKIVTHKRCFERGKRIENPSHKEQVKKLRKRLWRDRDISILSSLGPEAVQYLEALVKARQPIKRNVERLLELKDNYGTQSLIFAIQKAFAHKAYGADYIENILHQEMTPVRNQPPVKLKNDALNRIRLSEPSLEKYDAHIIKKGKSYD